MVRVARSFLAVAALWLSGAWLAAEEGKVGEKDQAVSAMSATWVVDDRGLAQRFQAELEKRLTEKSGGDTRELVRRLRELGAAKKSGREDGEGESADSRPEGEAGGHVGPGFYHAARAATLVLGHLYQCGKCSKWHASRAGAVVVGPDGLVMTNYHVVDSDQAEVFGAMTAEGRLFEVAEVLAASKADDLALLRLRAAEKDGSAVWPPMAVLAATDEPVGANVRVVSHPDGRFYTLTSGVVARYRLDTRTRGTRMEITADFAKGSSGCGLFNEGGQLVGLVSATDSIYYTEDRENQRDLQMVIKSTIPVSRIRSLIREASREGGTDGEKSLGDGG